MVQKSLISVANIAVLIIFILTNHLAWLGIESRSDLHRSLNWTLIFACIVLFRIVPKSSVKWVNELIHGYLIGWLIDVFLIMFYEYEETHLSEILAIIVPVIGVCWRKFRSKTEIAIAFSLVSYLVKIVSSGLIWLLNKLFL